MLVADHLLVIVVATALRGAAGHVGAGGVDEHLDRAVLREDVGRHRRDGGGVGTSAGIGEHAAGRVAGDGDRFLQRLAPPAEQRPRANPRRASCRATARPTPLPAPVTTAVRSMSLRRRSISRLGHDIPSDAHANRSTSLARPPTRFSRSDCTAASITACTRAPSAKRRPARAVLLDGVDELEILIVAEGDQRVAGARVARRAGPCQKFVGHRARVRRPLSPLLADL